jgi:hypothetical protein
MPEDPPVITSAEKRDRPRSVRDDGGIGCN